MKPKILLIYMDQSAKLGIQPYLSTIFHSYLEIHSQMADQIDFPSISQYQMILFSSARCQSLVYNTVCNYGIPMYQCRRDLNYTYLHRILEIPPCSDVCIVSDGKKNCAAIKDSLIALGFTQYQYESYYPGAPAVSSSIRYAITPGESRYAPPGLQTVIDIGNRNVDIATLCKIIMQFQLPETILNQITGHFAGYISNFMRYINQQLNQTANRILETEKILDHLEFGVCITSSTGKICLTNRTFRNMLCIDTAILCDKTLSNVLKDWNIDLEMKELLSDKNIQIQNYHNEQIDFRFSKKFSSANHEPRYLFLAMYHCGSTPAAHFPQLAEWRDPSDLPGMNTGIFRLLLQNPRLSSIMKLAGSYAEADFPVLILGDSGLYQVPIARFIHFNSSRSNKNFLYFDASNPSPPVSDAESPINIMDNPQSIFRQIVENNCGETLFIDNLDRATPTFQAFLCSFFKELETSRQFKLNTSGSIRIICSVGADLEDKMKSGRFLPDLFYQTGSLILTLPGIRDMREEIPAFLRFFLKDLFSDFSGQLETLFTEQILQFLTEYDYPGNFREMENLCRYFSCIYSGKRLTLNDLPPYIHYQAPDRTGKLTMQQKEILSIIQFHPHCGRSRISVLLSEKGISMTPHQVRTVMTDLAGKDYIRVLKTKQGCEITELGEYVLGKMH